MAVAPERVSFLSENELLNDLFRQFLHENQHNVYKDEEEYNLKVVNELNRIAKEAGYQENMMSSNGFKQKNSFNTTKCRICEKYKISNSFDKHMV